MQKPVVAHTASAQKQHNMSFGEGLDLVPALLSIGTTAILALLTGPSRARKQRKNPKQGVAKTLLLHVGYAILRKATIRLSMLQLQCVLLFRGYKPV
jgi:hypothetical protein